MRIQSIYARMCTCAASCTFSQETWLWSLGQNLVEIWSKLIFEEDIAFYMVILYCACANNELHTRFERVYLRFAQISTGKRVINLWPKFDKNRLIFAGDMHVYMLICAAHAQVFSCTRTMRVCTCTWFTSHFTFQKKSGC